MCLTNWVRKGRQKVVPPPPNKWAAPHSPPNHIPKGHKHLPFEHFQGWWFHHFSGEPVPLTDHTSQHLSKGLKYKPWELFPSQPHLCAWKYGMDAPGGHVKICGGQRGLGTTKVSQSANHVWITWWLSFHTSVSFHWVCVINELNGISGVYSAGYFHVSMSSWVEHRGVRGAPVIQRGRSGRAELMVPLMHTCIGTSASAALVLQMSWYNTAVANLS